MRKHKKKTLETFLTLDETQRKKFGWILLHIYKPSPKSKERLNLDDDFRYFVWYNHKTKDIICDCPAFTFRGKCKHSQYWQTSLKIILSEKENPFSVFWKKILGRD